MNFRKGFDEIAGEFQEFYRELGEGVELRDILMVSVVPVVLTGVFLLPSSVQKGFILNFQNIDFYNFFSYAFVHRGWDHFVGNLISYVSLVVPVYLLCVLAGEKRFFRYTWLIFVLALPVVIGLIEFASPVSPVTTAGFSGVDAAFLGVLPISLMLYLRNRISDEIQVAHAIVLLLLAVGTISLTYSGFSALTFGTITATVLLAIFYTYRTGVKEFKKVATEIVSMKGYFQLVLFALLFFLISPQVMFPAKISLGVGTVDIFAHYLGLLLGFFLPFVYITYRDAGIE